MFCTGERMRIKGLGRVRGLVKNSKIITVNFCNQNKVPETGHEYKDQNNFVIIY